MGSKIYSGYFGIPENAFFTTPDPRFLFMSERHGEALANLLYGVVESGCFILLTGEVGTGKTTVCRALLGQSPENVDVALLLRPPQTAQELLLAIADELNIFVNNRDASQHELLYLLTRRLLENYVKGRHTIVIIDEAQNTHPEVLEQVRLLTNFETHAEKLLHVFLVGQPELRDMLMKPSLRQVAQRITARYHLEALSPDETHDYADGHRRTMDGGRQEMFSGAVLGQLHHESKGTPRLINILGVRVPFGAFAKDLLHAGKEQITRAAHEWRGKRSSWQSKSRWRRYLLPASAAGLFLAAAVAYSFIRTPSSKGVPPEPAKASSARRLPMMEPAEPPANTQVAPSNELSGMHRSEAQQTLSEQAGVSLSDAREHANADSQSDSETKLPRPSASLVSDDLPAEDNQKAPNPAHGAPSTQSGLRYGFIGPGSPPEAVRWLRHQLDRMDGVVNTGNNPVYDEQLRRRVMELQRKHGLVMDGIAGPSTLKYISDGSNASAVASPDGSQPRT